MQLIQRNSITSDEFELAILEAKEDFSCTDLFDCDDADLNDFFKNDAFSFKKELLAETYYFKPIEATGKEIRPVAFVSFLNDAIQITKEEKKTAKRGFWNHLTKNIPHKKRGYHAYPAVKIGRLGVTKNYQHLHIGTSLLNMTKEYFTTANRTGCRFLTVEAYNKEGIIEFYKKNGFSFIWDNDEENETRIMFFDLKPFTSAD
jgi:GNAT superfamily N-acetyltransferase